MRYVDDGNLVVEVEAEDREERGDVQGASAKT